MSGLREIQRRMLARARAAAAKESSDAKNTLERGVYDPNLPAEKAALLAREEEIRQTLDLSNPSSPTSGGGGGFLYARNPSLTSPLFTPGESEEDPMASSETNAERQSAAPKSEKARGKMRERSESESTTVVDSELQRLATAGIGPNSYVPTQEWVSSWQKG